MKRGALLLVACFFLMSLIYAQNEMKSISKEPPVNWVIAIHGGAGGPARGVLAAEKEQQYLQKLDEVLKEGGKMLSEGRSALDVAEFCVKMMEDSPLFNAGKGSVFTAEAKNEMDASIMDGKTLMAGAVASVTTIKNPISAARAVMEKSPHVLLIGTGAEIFAKKQGLEIVDPSYFFTQERWDALQKAKKEEKDNSHGTVGAVVRDGMGNLAAATSTGGMTNKMKGRVGDSPIIGAGTYANNATCAVSATGHGEYFIRNVVAYDVSAQMEYKGLSLEEAATGIIMQKLKDQKAQGGLIAVDREGNVAMPFNTNAMFRGSYRSGGTPEVAIY
ncbi:MAG: isoaspartyl peptidase/L-asparaginase family protein [Syntrophothermus sp.]